MRPELQTLTEHPIPQRNLKPKKLMPLIELHIDLWAKRKMLTEALICLNENEI